MVHVGGTGCPGSIEVGQLRWLVAFWEARRRHEHDMAAVARLVPWPALVPAMARGPQDLQLGQDTQGSQEEPEPLPSPEQHPPTGQVSSAAVTISAATAPSASILGCHAALATAVSHSFGDR